mgnify:CR=1 FL=1
MHNSNYKSFSLIKRKFGEDTGSHLSVFIGESISDPKMLADVKTYIHLYLSAYTDLSFDEIKYQLANFTDTLQYDNYVIELKEI